jgi:hypothetical protein
LHPHVSRLLDIPHASEIRRVCFASTAIVAATWWMLPCLSHDQVPILHAHRRHAVLQILIALQLLQSLGIWPLGLLEVSAPHARFRFALNDCSLCISQWRGVLSFSSILLLFASPLLLRLLQRWHEQQLLPEALNHHEYNHANVTQSSIWQLPTLEQVPRPARHAFRAIDFSLCPMPLRLTPHPSDPRSHHRARLRRTCIPQVRARLHIAPLTALMLPAPPQNSCCIAVLQVFLPVGPCLLSSAPPSPRCRRTPPPLSTFSFLPL